MNRRDARPPRSADRFLGWFCRDELLEEVRGDLHEFYEMVYRESGRMRAWWAYWYHVLQFIRPFALKRKQKSNTLIMYRSYFKFAFRNISKHKGSTFMNVLSLSVGIACFIFIFIYLQGELSYDRFHNNADRIHRVAIDFVDSNGRRLPDATTPPALAPALKANFPEVESSVRIFPNWGARFLMGAHPETRFFEEDLIQTDSTFFDVFSFPLLYGDKETALDAPDQMLVSRKVALKYFGREDVIGETITRFGGETNNTYRISGVLEDVPYNSHVKFDFVIRITGSNLDTSWGRYNYYTYAKMVPGVDMETVEPKLQPFFEEQLGEQEFYNIIYSQPLVDIHLKSHLKWELEANGDINNVYIFSALGIFILLISCINYLNLTVAESLKRFKEVGVRKVFGAHRKSLTAQFMVETLVTVALSLALGSLMAELLFANLTDILGREVSLLQTENMQVFLLFSALILLIGIAAGLYPALHLSSFKVASAVKGMVSKSGKSVLGLRKTLLVVQFAISAFMIFGSIAVYRQLQHMRNLDKGFDTDQVVVIENAESLSSQKTFIAELGNIPEVSGASVSNGIIGGINWTFNLGYPDSFTMNYVAVDPGFVETMGMKLVAGRNFSTELETDRQGLNFIVNETGLKELGLTVDDVGKSVPMGSSNDSTTYNGTVLGVVKDFHFTDFRSGIKPFAFFYRDQPMPYLNVNISSENAQATMRDIQETWSQMSNGAPFSYYFLDQTFADLQAQEARLSDILKYLTGLALFIAFTGMFAIANLTIKDRKKEIAIRKVLGASISGVSNMITGKFLLLVLLANLIAGPLAYLAVQRWLEGFAYQASVGVTLFLVAILSTVLMAWATVGFQAFRAAVSNPVKSLRQE